MALQISFFAQKAVSKISALDSLRIELKNAKHDTTSLRIRCKMGEIDPVLRITFWDSLRIECEQLIAARPQPVILNNTYLECFFTILNNLGVIYSSNGETTKAFEYYRRSLTIGEKANNKEEIAISLNNIGFLYMNQGKSEKALECFNRSLMIREEIKNKSGIAESLNNIGGFYEDKGDIIKALEYFDRSLKVREANRGANDNIVDKKGVAGCLNNIAGIYDDQDDRAKALEYYHKSLILLQEINDKNGIANAFNNIGIVYKKESNISRALEYFKQSLKMREEINDRQGVAYSLNSIAGIYYIKNNIEKTKEYIEKSEKILAEINDLQGLSFSFNLMAKCLLKEEKIEAAFIYSARSLKIARQLGYPLNIKNSAELLYLIYKKQNKPKEALEMHELYIQMRDSINNAETRKASLKQQFKYEYEKKELLIKAEQEKKDILYADQNRSQKIIIGFVAGSLLLVLVFSIFLFKRFKITQNQKNIIEVQKIKVDEAYEKLHEKNKEVTDSIIYARRIQRALLTNEKYFDKHLSRLNIKK